MKMSNRETTTGLFMAAMYFWYTGEERMANDLIDVALMYNAPLLPHAIFEPGIFAEMALTDRKAGTKLS